MFLYFMVGYFIVFKISFQSFIYIHIIIFRILYNKLVLGDKCKPALSTF